MSVGSTANYGTVSIGGTAALIRAGLTGRKNITIQNVHATQVLYVGDDANVETTTGFRIGAGEQHTFESYNGAIYGIASGAGTDVRYWEGS